MNKVVKISIYAALIVAALYFGYNFFTKFNAASESGAKKANVEGDAPVQPPTDSTNGATNLDTNVIASATNAPAVTTNVIDGTNVALVTVVTNEVTNVVSETPTPPPRQASESDDTTGAVLAKAAKGKMWSHLGGFVGVLMILGLLAAYDASQYLGNRSVDFLFNDNLEGVHDPDYEVAEQLYSNGKPLEAIQLLREYLKKNPRQQHASLRIAEIYEKDLRNYLAAALEYEDILKNKLPRERWGWAAIHLCNLYSKLGKNDQTVALLRRIADEYSETAAAKKARKRLAIYEAAGDAEALATDEPEDPNMPDVPFTPKPVAQKQDPEDSPPSNLPPGFRPRK